MNPQKTTLKYKALMLDCDGTIIPIARHAIPSIEVTKAIAKASKLVHVGLATSRPYKDAENILSHLQLSGFSIINGGAQIVDATTRNIVWEQTLDRSDAQKICAIAEKIVQTTFFLNDGVTDHQVSAGFFPQKIFQVYIPGLSMQIADQLISELSQFSQASVHKVPSWEKNAIDVIVGHVYASKQHGIFEVAKLLNIEPHEIIGVGDGYNDFPLLMACGLKVAMGNAVQELKEIADYIAPSVEDNGVVDIIEKFIL